MKARSRGANQPAATEDSDVEAIDAPPRADQFEVAGTRVLSCKLGMDQGTKLRKLLKEFVHVAVSVFLCVHLPHKRENQRSEAEAVTVGGEDRAASVGAASQRAGEEASGGSPGSAAGAASQRAGEEASGDEESSGAASASEDESLPSPLVT